MALAGELAELVLSEVTIQRAAMLRRLVADASPFALVRATELAELLLTTTKPHIVVTRTRG